MIQCKRSARAVGNAAVKQGHAARSYQEAGAAAVMANCGFTRGARALAERAGVALISRQQMEAMLRRRD